MAQIGGGQNRLKPNSHFTHSHKLPKIALSLALLLGGANIALAEESGGFVGIGIGGGGIQSKFTYPEQTIKSPIANGFSYGIIGGYKYFFTKNLGARFYANVDMHHPVGQNLIMLPSYGANADFLASFAINELFELGGFVGVGLGGATYYVDEIIGGFNQTSFDVGLNLGIRGNIVKNHGVELAVKVPFLPVVKIKDTDSTRELGQVYNVLVRYVYTF